MSQLEGSQPGVTARDIASRAVPPPRSLEAAPKIAVVIPCYKVVTHILAVLARIGPEVASIYVVDDACPQGSGDLVRRESDDPRITVITHASNQGVGGATMTGMRQAIADGADIIVKIDGDGQMDPALVPRFVRPIAEHRADYTKGNRFFRLEDIQAMPFLRRIGNAGLSLLSKLSTGYWHIFDPTNGYIAIEARVAALLPWDKIEKRFFFESDLLFRLNTLRAKVIDVPMVAVYADEVSNLSVSRSLVEFSAGHVRNFVKRIFYNYYLRNFSIASVELILGIVLLFFGIGVAAANWRFEGNPTPPGTVMLAALPILTGIQLLIAFFNYDIESAAREPLHLDL